MLKIYVILLLSMATTSFAAHLPEAQRPYEGSLLGLLPADVFKELEKTITGSELYRLESQIKNILEQHPTYQEGYTEAMNALKELARQKENAPFFSNRQFVDNLAQLLHKQYDVINKEDEFFEFLYPAIGPSIKKEFDAAEDITKAVKALNQITQQKDNAHFFNDLQFIGMLMSVLFNYFGIHPGIVIREHGFRNPGTEKWINELCGKRWPASLCHLRVHN